MNNTEGIKQKVERFQERLLDFAVVIFQLVRSLPYKKEFEVFRIQLPKSATSMGANYEEAQAGSRAEFQHPIQICLREARETKYWLTLIKRLDIRDIRKLEPLIKESRELTLIFGSISSKIKSKQKK